MPGCEIPTRRAMAEHMASRNLDTNALFYLLVVGWALEYFGADSDDEQPSQAGAGKHRDDDRPLDAPPRL